MAFCSRLERAREAYKIVIALTGAFQTGMPPYSHRTETPVKTH